MELPLDIAHEAVAQSGRGVVKCLSPYTALGRVFQITNATVLHI